LKRTFVSLSVLLIVSAEVEINRDVIIQIFLQLIHEK